MRAEPTALGRATLPLPAARSRLSFAAYADLLLLAALAGLLPVAAQLLIPLLRVPLGLAAVVLAPGYALTAALFARHDDLDGVGRGALSFGLSVAVLPVLALVLDTLPWGLRPWPMAVGLATWIGLCAGLAAIRRALLGPAAFVPAFPRVGLPAWSELAPARQAGYGGGLVVAAGLLLWAGLIGASATQAPRLTEFYALGAEGLAEGYPRAIAPGAALQVTLGIANREGARGQYRVEVRAGGELVADVDWFTVEPDARWERPLRFALPRAGRDQAVDILLFHAGRPTPYRRLQLWVDVGPGQ